MADSYPFKQYTINQEVTRKRAISHQDITQLKAVEPQTDRHRDAKDYFLISFYLMKASFVDLADVKEDITGYPARHTFTTMAKFKGVPVAAISEALGHADIKTWSGTRR